MGKKHFTEEQLKAVKKAAEEKIRCLNCNKEMPAPKVKLGKISFKIRWKCKECGITINISGKKQQLR